jgi:hypothetical protein
MRDLRSGSGVGVTWDEKYFHKKSEAGRWKTESAYISVVSKIFPHCGMIFRKN